MDLLNSNEVRRLNDCCDDGGLTRVVEMLDAACS
jgi:hypothetical protein